MEFTNAEDHPMSFILRVELILKKDAVMTFQESTHFTRPPVNCEGWDGISLLKEDCVIMPPGGIHRKSKERK